MSDVPRPHREPAGGRQRPQPLFGFGSDLQVVVDHRHLAVQEEPGVRRVPLENRDELVEHVDQAHPEASGTARTTPGPSGCGGRWLRIEA